MIGNSPSGETVSTNVLFFIGIFVQQMELQNPVDCFPMGNVSPVTTGPCSINSNMVDLKFDLSWNCLIEIKLQIDDNCS